MNLGLVGQAQSVRITGYCNDHEKETVTQQLNIDSRFLEIPDVGSVVIIESQDHVNGMLVHRGSVDSTVSIINKPIRHLGFRYRF